MGDTARMAAEVEEEEVDVMELVRRLQESREYQEETGNKGPQREGRTDGFAALVGRVDDTKRS